MAPNCLSQIILALVLAFALFCFSDLQYINDISAIRTTIQPVPRYWTQIQWSVGHDGAVDLYGARNTSALSPRADSGSHIPPKPGSAAKTSDTSTPVDGGPQPGSSEASSSPPPPLTPAEKEEAFQDCRCRGQRLLALLDQQSNAHLSPWKQYSDLAAWGWTLRGDKTPAAWKLTALSKVLSDIGADQDPAANPDYWWTHDRATVHRDGTQDLTYKATGGQFYNIFNAKSGLIIALYLRLPSLPQNVSPKTHVEGNHRGTVPKDFNLPKLAQWSDNTYLTWASATDEKTRAGLKYVLRDSIVNPQSDAVIAKALATYGSSGDKLVYPGYTFARNQDADKAAAFEALIGTPNVSGVAWLLVRHSEAMGKRTIKSIKIWHTMDTQPRTKKREAAESKDTYLLIELAPVGEVPDAQRARL